MALLSKHASRRCQQRAINPMIIDFLEWFGCVRAQQGKGSVLMLPMSPEERAEMRRNLKSILSLIDREVFAVLTDDGRVITAGHQHKKIRTAY